MSLLHILKYPFYSTPTSYNDVAIYVRSLPSVLSLHVENEINNKWVFPEVYNPAAYLEFVMQIISNYEKS
jgi:hypothetical protein